MTERLWKVVRPDMSSRHDPNFVYQVGATRRRGTVGEPVLCTSTVLHACRTPEQAAVYAGGWPYRLLEVAGAVAVEDDEKVGCRQLTVVAEHPVHLCFGPNGRQVEAVIRRAETLTRDEAIELNAAWAAARAATRAATWNAAWNAAGGAARAAAGAAAWAAGNAVWDAAGAAAWDAGAAAWAATRSAARACVVADLVGHHGLTQEHLDTLRGPWEQVLGPTWEEAA